MRRHAGLPLYPFHRCFRLPCALLLLLATVVAVGDGALLPQNGKEHHTLSSGTVYLRPSSRVTLQKVPRCIPKGNQHIFGVTADVQCPCLVRFSLARGMRREIRGRTVDFLIVSSEEAEFVREQPRRNVSFIPRYSIPGTRAAFDDSTNEYRYLSPGFEISEPSAFALVLRTTSPRDECGLSVGYVLEPVPVQCPLRLDAQQNAPIEATSTNAADTVLAPRVVGGAPPTDRHRASMVSFVRKEGLYCSGSYIAPGWILTAAHCRVSVGDTAFIGGENGITGWTRKVAKVVPHPSYDFSKSNGPYDIAIVQLLGTAIVGPVPLPINIKPTLPAEMSYVRIAGYGRISEDFAAADPPSLRTVDLPVVPMVQCLQKYTIVNMDVPLNPTVQLCAGYVDGECDACQGDSGGPVLVLDEAGGPVQVGIVSYGMGCANGGIPGVYTRIAPFAKWIQSVVTNVQMSSSGTVVIARSLNSNVNGSAPPAGLGIDGIDPDKLDTFGVSEIVGETRIVTLLKIVVPSVIVCVSIIFFLIACVMCFAASRYRDQTLSDYATGKRTKTLGGDSSDRPGAGSSLADSIFGAFPVLSSPKPSPPMPPPKVWSPPVNPPPPRQRRRPGRRRKQQEIVRMPEDVLRMEQEEAGIPIGGAVTLPDQPRGVHEAREAESQEMRSNEPLPRRRSKRDSGRGQSERLADQPGGVYGAREGDSPEMRMDETLPRRSSKRDSGRGQSARLADQPSGVHGAREGGSPEMQRDETLPRRSSKRDSGRGQSARLADQPSGVHGAREGDSPEMQRDEAMPRRSSKRDSGRGQPMGILRHPDREEMEARVDEPRISEEVEELERRRRNDIFEERYPTIQNPASTYLIPAFDEIEPERTSTRPIVRFRDDLYR